MPAQTASVFAHIVTFDSARFVTTALQSLFEQNGFESGRNLRVSVTDNASKDGSAEVVAGKFAERISLRRNSANLGFCGAHNQGVRDFLDSKAHFLLILNPDVRLAPDALKHLCAALESHSQAGMACARLMRADDQLNPVSPALFDSAGMYMTPAIRHFDRGSNQADIGQYREAAFVFGGTGACLLIRRECVNDLLLEASDNDASLFSLYPQLRDFRNERAQLFDEAFFAYREDADLAWRAQRFGWKCIYQPLAEGFHRRVVLPERRSTLPPELNLLGVRNRFLLQLNNYTFDLGWRCLLEGLLFRNFLVLLALFVYEQRSLKAVPQLLALWKRAKVRRALIMKKAAERGWSSGSLARWFNSSPVEERI